MMLIAPGAGAGGLPMTVDGEFHLVSTLTLGELTMLIPPGAPPPLDGLSPLLLSLSPPPGVR